MSRQSLIGTRLRLGGSTGRSLIVLLAVAAAAAALLTGNRAIAQQGECIDSSCFFSNRVRDFQIIDDDTLVVFVGQDRCPYIIEVSGLFCDVTFLPEVQLVRARDLELEARRGLRSTSNTGSQSNDRVCANNASAFALRSFGFTALEDIEDVAAQGRIPCELSGIRPASDNDLMELLTEEGIAPPPPPIGNGEISRTEDGAQ